MSSSGGGIEKRKERGRYQEGERALGLG